MTGGQSCLTSVCNGFYFESGGFHTRFSNSRVEGRIESSDDVQDEHSHGERLRGESFFWGVKFNHRHFRELLFVRWPHHKLNDSHCGHSRARWIGRRAGTTAVKRAAGNAEGFKLHTPTNVQKLMGLEVRLR